MTGIQETDQSNHETERSGRSIASAQNMLEMRGGVLQTAFNATNNWKHEFPRTLVVACSDGRLQGSTDEFLEESLGVIDYDRLYSPGGAGALAVGNGAFNCDQLRRELKLLTDAHQTEQIVLLFHGADSTGPDLAVCAHYQRILPGASRYQISMQQHADAAEAISVVSEIAPKVSIRVYCAQVRSDNSVHFDDFLRRP